MYHSTKPPTCPYKIKAAGKALDNKAARSIRSAGRSIISEPANGSFKSAADVERNQNAKTPKKFKEDDSVYDSHERDGSGRVKGEKGKRYWICCITWSKSKKKWIYRLKDAPFPRGKDVCWVEEHYLHKWPVES